MTGRRILIGFGLLGAGATTRCADCGELGERTGHMGCQYPQDRP